MGGHHKTLWILIASFLSLPVWGQDIIPGLIPRFYSIEAATDLTLPQEKAHELAISGREDISLLEPDTGSDIWSPNQTEISRPLLLAQGETVHYISDLKSRTGIYRFGVRNNQGEEFIVLLSKKSHNILLRKNILEKLGYNVPATQWLPDLRLSFKNTIDRDLFLEEMKDKLLAGAARWLISQNGLDVHLQDVVVQTPESEIYNLSLGLMNAQIHLNRRLLRAPYIALALVDSPESINLMPWQAGRVILDQIKLFHSQDVKRTFGTSFEDARWIGRKIAQLSRPDIEDIVREAHFPPAVESLLVEKISSRRNDLLKLLKLDGEFSTLPFDPQITVGKAVIEGEIRQEFFDGYTSRFSYGDPESPFSTSEIGAFIRSRIQSEAFTLAINRLNDILGTQDEKVYKDKVIEILKKEDGILPTSTIVIPSVHGSAILSRDIVSGSYLGTNHKVQLVDNIGFNLDIGVLAGVEGLPVPVNVMAGTSVAIQRVFSHIKPIQSIKKSMKEPYKNLIVPFLIKDLAHKIDNLSHHNSEDLTQALMGVVNQIKSSLEVGESFIVTDSVVPSLALQVRANLSEWILGSGDLVKLYAGVMQSRVVLSRLHILRADDNTLHIYQDHGKNLKLMASISLKALMPVLKFSGEWNKATAETFYYPISLAPNQVSVETLKALRATLLSLNHEPLRSVQTPHQIEHVIKERLQANQFFFFKNSKIRTQHYIKAQHARGGDPIQIHRRYDTKTSGVDYENFAIETLNELAKKITDTDDYKLSASPVLNPGFTIGGRAKNSLLTSEYNGDRTTTRYEKIFNGWQAKPNHLKHLLSRVNKESGKVLINPLSYKDTDSILLYRIQMQALISQEGTEALVNLSPNQVQWLFAEHSHSRVKSKDFRRFFRRLSRLQSKARKSIGQDPDEILKNYHKWLQVILDHVTIEGIRVLVGSKNIALQARVDGFRQGDESGDSPILSDVLGELPLPLHEMPTEKIRQSINIIEGELLANWIVRRAI